jgi:acyl carrier protein
MPDRSDEVKSTVKDFVLREFLPGEDPAELRDDTPLITGGILDSIATLRLVSFLEDQFRIRLAAHEAGVHHLNTLDDIADLVHSKLGTKS